MAKTGRKHVSVLSERMRWEIVQRGITGTYPIIPITAVAVFYPFGRQLWEKEIRGLAALVLLLAIARIFFLKNITEEKKITSGQYRVVEAFIAANSIFFGGALSLVLLDMLQSGSYSIFGIGTLLGFATGGISTLAASKRLYGIYLLCMDGFPILVSLYAEFVLHAQVDHGLYYVFVVILLYALRESADYRRRLIHSHLDKMRLEIRNRKVVKSRQELMEQTARNVHSSRLASLGEMAGGVAHEINNPLAIIDLNLDSLRTMTEEDLVLEKEVVQKVLNRCQASVSRITKIVRALKNFSRAGDQDPLEVVSVSKLVEETFDLCREKIFAHGIDFSVSGDLNWKVQCRPVEISQILINLINNAVDVVVGLPKELRSIKLTAENGPENLYLKISNSGPQIPRPLTEKLFQPFFTTKPVGSGTGLGLSISKAIARKHGGDLYLEAGEPETTFVLRIPRMDPSGAEVPIS